MRRRRVVVAHGAEEDVTNKTEAIRGGKERTDGRQSRDKPRHAKQRGSIGLLQHHFFGQEAVEKRYPRHRQRRKSCDCEGHGHQLAQPPKAADVAGVGLVINNPCGHKERGLECRVVEDMEHSGHRAKGRTCAEKHGDQTKMRHRREGQKRFQIMFEEGNHRTKHHCDQASRCDDHKPLGRTRKHGPHSRHEEDPRLHHRGRMQVGRDGRRRSHRVREPEVEGELCRLGEAAQQDQQKRRQIKRVRLD